MFTESTCQRQRYITPQALKLLLFESVLKKTHNGRKFSKKKFWRSQIFDILKRQAHHLFRDAIKKIFRGRYILVCKYWRYLFTLFDHCYPAEIKVIPIAKINP